MQWHGWLPCRMLLFSHSYLTTLLLSVLLGVHSTSNNTKSNKKWYFSLIRTNLWFCYISRQACTTHSTWYGFLRDLKLYFDFSILLFCKHHSSLKTLLLERTSVRSSDTDKKKPIGAVRGNLLVNSICINNVKYSGHLYCLRCLWWSEVHSVVGMSESACQVLITTVNGPKSPD